MADAARSQITQGALKYEHNPIQRSLVMASSAIFNDPDRLQRDFPVPVCQCVQVKTLASTTEGGQERFRLVLSDISNFVQSMLATRKLAVTPRGPC
jgi:replication factor A1